MTSMQQLTAFNTFGLESQALNYIVLSSLSQLPELALQIENEQNYFVLGGGSNVVLGQQIKALIIHNQLKGIELVQETDEAYFIEAQGGELWHDFVDYCLQQGWNGLENLALIPGTVGACPVQNIGAYGVEVMDCIDRVRTYHIPSKTVKELSAAQCDFSYRDSLFKHQEGHLICSVVFRLPKKWQAKLSYPDLKNHASLQNQPSSREIFNAVCEIRKNKLPDPALIGNAGSFFKNPVVDKVVFETLSREYETMPHYPQANGQVKLAAAWLIDQCAWKGKSLGPVGVHAKQALVLINLGGATARDVLALAQQIKIDVQQKFGVLLEQEPVNVETGLNLAP